MSISDTTRKSFLSFTMLAAAASALNVSSSHAAAAETYEWSATLVLFEPASGTAVLQERVEGHANIDGLDGFADGDRLTLVWTGRTWASGIRDLAREPEVMPGQLSLPVEFVSSERDGEYINFRIKVPADSIDRLAAMEPGTRVTGESPRGGAAFDDAVITLRHYNDVN